MNEKLWEFKAYQWSKANVHKGLHKDLLLQQFIFEKAGGRWK